MYFHAVYCRGTEIVLEAARKRGVSRFLHCSTEIHSFRFTTAGIVRYRTLSLRRMKCLECTHARNSPRNSALYKLRLPDFLL